MHCARADRCDFQLTDNVNAAYLKERHEGMSVFHNCSCTAVHIYVTPRKQAFFYQPNENRDQLDESMAIPSFNTLENKGCALLP